MANHRSPILRRHQPRPRAARQRGRSGHPDRPPPTASGSPHPLRLHLAVPLAAELAAEHPPPARQPRGFDPAPLPPALGRGERTQGGEGREQREDARGELQRRL